MKERVCSFTLALIFTSFGYCVTAESGTNAEQFARTYTYCLDVDTTLVTPPEEGVQRWQLSANNQFAAIWADLLRVWKMKGNVFSQELIKKIGLKVTELAAPQHGRILADDVPSKELSDLSPDEQHPPIPNGPRSFTYFYLSDPGYIGKDRVVYEVVAYEKRYKVVINFFVLGFVDQEAYQCIHQKFSD